LLNLPEFFGDKETETAVEVARCIGAGEEFPSDLCSKLDTWFIAKKLF